MPECINLRERFGKQYRIRFDEAYDHAHVPRDKLDPWMMVIPCEKGTIYPYGGNQLAIEIDYHSPTANKIRSLPEVACIQNGEHEKTFTFPVGMFDAIAELVRPKQRMQLSEEERQRRADRMRQLHSQNQEKDASRLPESTEDDENELGDG